MLLMGQVVDHLVAENNSYKKRKEEKKLKKEQEAKELEEKKKTLEQQKPPEPAPVKQPKVFSKRSRDQLRGFL